MRIAMITGEYPPMEGGVGAFTARLSEAMVVQGHHVDVLTTRLPGGPGGSVSENGVLAHYVVENWKVGSMAQIRHWLRLQAPDVINVQYEPAAYGMKAGINFLPRLLGSADPPVVVTFHDLLPPYLFPKAGPLRPWSVRQLARRSHGVIATNRDDLTAMKRILRDAPPEVRLIPIGSNITAQTPPGYDRNRWRARYALQPDDLVVAFFGFLNRTKGIETLVAAIARLAQAGHPVHLLFIGGRTGTSDVTNARYADEVDALIDELGLTDRVHWTGFASPAEVSAAFYAADLCALPYREGANLRHGTLHAALAHGCATVTTTPTASFPELEPERNVLLVPPDDPAALSAAIVTLSQDQGLAARLGRAARELSRRFSWPEIATETIAFFKTLLSADDSAVMVE